MINSNEIDAELENYRKNGGSIIYSVKDLLAHIDKKIDMVCNKLSTHENCIGNNETAIKGIAKQLVAMWSLIIACLGLVGAMIAL